MHSFFQLFVLVIFHFTAITFAIALADRMSSQRKTVSEYFAVAGSLTAFFVTLAKETLVEIIATLIFPLGMIDIDRISPPKGTTANVPVLFLHGYLMNRSNFLFMRHYLKRNGFTHLYSLNLGNPMGGIDAHLATLGAKIAEIVQECGAVRIDIVAHSMGGIVSLRHVQTAGADSAVRRIVAIASPFAGTRLASFGFGASARDMIPGSDMLRAIAASQVTPDLVSIYSEHDNMVVPYESSVSPLPTAKNILIPHNGHHSLLFSPRVFKAVHDELKRV